MAGLGTWSSRVRTWFFWSHLVLGVIGGVAIFTMSVTGALLALQPQVLEWVEADQRRVTVPPGATRLEPGALLAAATRGRTLQDGASLLRLRAPDSAAVITIGRGQVVFVDPYSGAVLGEGARGLRRTFQWLTEFHRWFAVPTEHRATARSVTGWSTVGFVGLALTGAILWIPRKRTWALVVRGLTPAWPSTAAARHFNWHTVAGIWSVPVLLVLALSGVVIAFPWATTMLYALAGTPAPVAARAEQPLAQPRGRAAAGPSTPPDFRRLDAAWNQAERQVPTWGSITLRIQGRTNGPLSFTITDASHWNPFARSQLVMSGADGSVVRWEPYAGLPRGQRWRGWARFAHTGELGGLTGQLVAGIACVSAALLVYTGLSLALTRLARARRSSRDDARAA